MCGEVLGDRCPQRGLGGLGQAAERFRGAAGEVEEGLPVGLGVAEMTGEIARPDVDVVEAGGRERGGQ